MLCRWWFLALGLILVVADAAKFGALWSAPCFYTSTHLIEPSEQLYTDKELERGYATCHTVSGRAGRKLICLTPKPVPLTTVFPCFPGLRHMLTDTGWLVYHMVYVPHEDRDLVWFPLLSLTLSRNQRNS